ncbi:MAG: phosphoenolpyruvate carboxykinase [Dissulfurimicrobium hydrothermale]|uniref:phosphoenolpyruvate carboxykinase n=1 Tax=Dissulfurimicrobium hydrothermale TaxID=1750598 RepID=UPI003C76EA9F
MAIKGFVREGRQYIIYTDGKICASKRELLQSDVFEHIFKDFVESLCRQDSSLLDSLGLDMASGHDLRRMINILRALSEHPLEQVTSLLPAASILMESRYRYAIHQFVERLYDYWRSFDRYMVLLAGVGPGGSNRRPYRAFNDTLVALAHKVRSLYRDMCENITGTHPRVYRHVAAGCNAGVIAAPKDSRLPSAYRDALEDVPFIRQVWFAPPFVIDPPTNTRTGRFRAVSVNPIEGLHLSAEEWLCYPARVGPVVIFIYFHRRFMGLGISLSNLFELALDEQIEDGPEAVYVFGVPADHMAKFGDLPTVFFDDAENGLLTAAIPLEDRFGYFGYLKKMALTLHNIVMMKLGRMPYHGAMVRILLKGGNEANILIIGDTAAGKSESLEAFRSLGRDLVQEMRVVADDMGSLEIAKDGRVIAYGTETGAFIRLDDLQQGYAFGQIDRAIIMSPQKVNARVVLPVTTIEEVLHGYPIDFLLYANNYEEVDQDHPIIERFDSVARAIEIFRDGAVMSKGTTAATGLVHSYFANIFGPPQYRELHDDLALGIFETAIRSGVFVGQLRTRLGIPGYETKGPHEAAIALLRLISSTQEV